VQPKNLMFWNFPNFWRNIAPSRIVNSQLRTWDDVLARVIDWSQGGGNAQSWQNIVNKNILYTVCDAEFNGRVYNKQSEA